MGILSRGGATNLDSFHDDIISEIINLIYPVGSIYMSVNSTNPGELFGGTWEQIQGRFLLGQGSGYSAGATGGEAEHTLSIAEMPKHGHKVFLWTGGSDDNGAYTGMIINPETNKLETASKGAKIYHRWKGASFNTWGNADGAGNGSGDVSGNTGFAGASAGHNNMPPYLVVYIWKRTA